MKTVQSRFRVLLAEKEQNENRTISLREVCRDTGVAITTVSGLANNTLLRVGLHELAILCRYLECDVGDLLYMADDD